MQEEIGLGSDQLLIGNEEVIAQFIKMMFVLVGILLMVLASGYLFIYKRYPVLWAAENNRHDDNSAAQSCMASDIYKFGNRNPYRPYFGGRNNKKNYSSCTDTGKSGI